MKKLDKYFKSYKEVLDYFEYDSEESEYDMEENMETIHDMRDCYWTIDLNTNVLYAETKEKLSIGKGRIWIIDISGEQWGITHMPKTVFTKKDYTMVLDTEDGSINIFDTKKKVKYDKKKIGFGN